MTAAPTSKLDLVSPVEVRQTANLFKRMAADYSLAIEAAEKITKHADTSDMRHKKKALLLGNRLLMSMLGVPK